MLIKGYRTFSLSALLLVLLLVVSVNSAAAQDAATDPALAASNPRTAGHIRVANFVTDASEVALLLDGMATGISGLPFGSVSDWVDIAGANYQLSIAANGDDDVLAARQTLNLTYGSYFTVVLTGEAGDESVRAFYILADTTAPLAGGSRVTFFNALSSDGSVNLRRDDQILVGQSLPATWTTVTTAAGESAFTVIGDGNTLIDPTTIRLTESYDYILAAVDASPNNDVADAQLIVASTDRATFQIGLGALPAPGTVMDALSVNPFVGALPGALEAAGLNETLAGEGQYTLLAPALFSASAVADLSEDEVRMVLLNHVVEGEYMVSDLVEAGTVTTLAGNTLTVRTEGGRVYINDLQVQASNFPATNGVVHIIAAPLLP